MAYCTLV